PVGAYRHILLGTRLDAPSAEMARWLARNPLGGSPDLSMLFVHDPHGALPLADHANLPLGTSNADEELQSARKALRNFLVENDLADRVYPQARLLRGPVSLELDDYSLELDCD